MGINDEENDNNGWHEWSKFVLAELKRLNRCYANLDKNMNKLFTEVAMLTVKSGVWGLLAGCIPVVIAITIYFLLR